MNVHAQYVLHCNQGIRILPLLQEQLEYILAPLLQALIFLLYQISMQLIKVNDSTSLQLFDGVSLVAVGEGLGLVLRVG